MQSTVKSTLDNPRIQVTVYMRCLLERLAKAGHMDWFLTETQRRSTLTGAQVTKLAQAFKKENLAEFDDQEIVEIYTWYARMFFDTTHMSFEMINYFRNDEG